jgi:hypothetical protein
MQIARVAKLYGRCLALTVGTETIEVKVMGDRADAGKARERLLTAFEAMGVAVVVGEPTA